MTHDYPDNTRLFHLVGTEITIPIRIEASDVTLPVSIDAATATVPIDIKAATVAVNVRLFSSMITLNVNLHSQTANINFAFADQSVAVFDAAKWFAHKAKQWGITGTGSIAAGAFLSVYRTVPADKVALVCGISGGYHAAVNGGNMLWQLSMAGTYVTRGGGNLGFGLIFDVPFRATEGQGIYLYVYNWSGAEREIHASFWGYDEPEEA